MCACVCVSASAHARACVCDIGNALAKLLPLSVPIGSFPVTRQALLSLSAVCGASLGVVLAAAGAGCVSVSWRSSFVSKGPFLQRIRKQR